MSGSSATIQSLQNQRRGHPRSSGLRCLPELSRVLASCLQPLQWHLSIFNNTPCLDGDCAVDPSGDIHLRVFIPPESVFPLTLRRNGLCIELETKKDALCLAAFHEAAHAIIYGLGRQLSPRRGFGKFSPADACEAHCDVYALGICQNLLDLDGVRGSVETPV